VKKKTAREQAAKLTFRLDEEYAGLVAQLSETTGIAPNLLGRMAIVLMVKNRLHEFPERLKRVEDCSERLNDSVIRLIKDFNDAVYEEAA